MKLKQLAAWAVVIFAGYCLLTRPSTAPLAITNLLHFLRSWGTSIASFLNGLS